MQLPELRICTVNIYNVGRLFLILFVCKKRTIIQVGSAFAAKTIWVIAVIISIITGAPGSTARTRRTPAANRWRWKRLHRTKSN